MLKKVIARVGLVIGSIIAFYALLVLGILIPLLHQENFQDFLKINLNERVLIPQALTLDYAHMEVSLLPLSLTLSNVQLFSLSPSTPHPEVLQLHISAAQAKVRVSFSRLLLGRLYVKTIDLQNPHIFVKLPPPKKSSQVTAFNWDPWQSGSPLPSLSHLINTVAIHQGQVAFSSDPHTQISIKQINATATLSTNQVDVLWDIQKMVYQHPDNEFTLDALQAQTTLTPQRWMARKLTLTHATGALVLESASVHLGHAYSVQNLQVGISSEIVQHLAKIKSVTLPPDIQTLQGHVKLTASVKGLWGKFPTGQAHISTKSFQYTTLALDQIELPLTLSEDTLLIQQGRLSGFYGQLVIPKLSLGLKDPFPLQGIVTPDHLHFSPFMRLAGITECLSFFDVSGPIQLEGTLTPFHLQGQSQFQISNFFVPPTVAEASDPSKTIIQFPQGTLQGSFSITKDLTTFHQFDVKVDQTHLKVTGTIVHNPIDVNLDIDTPRIHLDHLKTIGKLAVAGQGPLKAHLQVNDIGLFIRGDVEFEEALVGLYHLPHVRAHVTYADEQLHFQNIGVTQEGTTISADARVDLQSEITFQLSANIQQADVTFIKTFLGPDHDFYLKHLSQGVVFGSVEMKGPAEPNVLAGHYQLEAHNVRYAGERFQKMVAAATFGKARMDFQTLWLQKGNAKIQVQGNLGPGPQLQLHVASDPIPLSAFHLTSQHNASATGSGTLQGSVVGSFSNPDVQLVLNIPSALLGTTSLPKDLRFELNNKNKKVNLSIHQAGTQWAYVTWITQSPYPFTLELNIKESPWLAFLGMRFPHLLSSSSHSKLSVSGKISGNWDHFFQTTTGSLVIHELSVSDGQEILALKASTPISIRSGKTPPTAFHFEDSQNQRLTLTMGFSAEKPFTAHAQGTLSAHVVNLLTHVMTQWRGVLNGDISLSRTPEGSWHLSSQNGISSEQLLVQFPFMPEEIRFESLKATFHQGVLRLKKFLGHLKEGTIAVEGSSSFHPHTLLPRPHLNLTLGHARLSVPQWMTGVYTGPLLLTTHADTPFALTGHLELSTGRNHQAFLGQNTQPSAFEPLLSRKKPDDSSLTFNLTLVIPPESFQVKYSFLTTSIGGKLLLTQSPEIPQVSGAIHSSSGLLRFRNHEFSLESFELQFDPTHLWKSRVFLQSHSTIQGYLIKLNARGILENYEYEFTSVPYLPKREVLALLLFGRQHEELTEADQTELLQIDLGNTIIQQMPLAESLEQETGLQFKIAPATSSQEASISRISVRKKVAQNLEAQVTTELNAQSGKTYSLEYDLSRRVSIRGSLQEPTSSSRQVQYPQTQQRVGLDVRIKSEFD